MSTTLYGLLTTRRLSADPGASTNPGQQGLSTAIDAIAALVPAEVLALHTTIVGLSTTASETTGPDGSTAITSILAQASTMSVLFWALLVVSVAFYVIPLRRMPEGVGWYRLAIPPLAFLAWAVMQDGSLFYAAFPGAAGWPAGFRLGFALIAAALVGTVAKRLGATADRSLSDGSSPPPGETPVIGELPPAPADPSPVLGAPSAMPGPSSPMSGPPSPTPTPGDPYPMGGDPSSTSGDPSSTSVLPAPGDGPDEAATTDMPSPREEPVGAPQPS